MYKSILVIKNATLYPSASKFIEEMKIIFNEMDYSVQELDECEENYSLKLQSYIEETKKTVECKAILCCNAIGIEAITQAYDGLYITYIEKVSGIEEKLNYGNKRTVVFCTSQDEIDYVTQNYSNLGSVLYVNFNAGEEVELTEEQVLAQTQMAFDIQELIAVSQGKSSMLKLLIERSFSGGNFQQIRYWIDEYCKYCPLDMDVISMETMYSLYTGDIQLALQWALKGVKSFPTSGDLYYNLGTVYENLEEWYLAWLAYYRAGIIYSYSEEAKIGRLDLKAILDNIRDKCVESTNCATLEELEDNGAGLREIGFRNSSKPIVGRYYWETETNKKYVGIYRDYFLRNAHTDLIHLKGEFVEVTEGKDYKVSSGEGEVLLPIASANNDTRHMMYADGKEYLIKQRFNKHFNYYRVPAGTQVYSSDIAYYGKPIPLVHDKKRKKLVLNIFVDGLAQAILDGTEFEKNMPNTASFFDKGTVCTRAYNTAEWTYPSIVNYVTGVSTTQHMLFHNMLDWRIPEEYTTLAEYFQEKGYFTSKHCGNWRIIPTYGHARGYDQFIYQHQWQGYKAEMLIGEVIDHIEAFKETDQFLWMSIGDLHDVADGIDMPNAVQSRLDIEDCVEEVVGRTSVQQEYSELKSRNYKAMAKRIDVLLGTLYRYLQENYADEDIIVSLFSDHGQGYLVPTGSHFCAPERSKVAFMFRGSDIKQSVCDEVISTSDYIKIMCKLADIEMKNVEIEGKLPRGFGGMGRDYALTESIHPGDAYNAAIYAEDSIFYFTNPFPVQHDGRFYLKEYKMRLTDLEGNDLIDDVKCEKYLRIILEHIAPICIYE